MASADDEFMTVLQHSSGSMDVDPQYEDMDEYHHNQPHSLSRLSICTSNSTYDHEDDDDDGIRLFMSGLSIQSFDGDADADEELFSDEKESRDDKIIGGGMLSSDSDDRESLGWHSLPASPPSQQRRRRRSHPMSSVAFQFQHLLTVGKEYASETDAQNLNKGKRISSGRRRRKRREKRDYWHNNQRDVKEVSGIGDGGWTNYTYNSNHSYSGESESGGGGGMMIITRPKGGKRSICMDMEEVKACRDLGFELEHEHTLGMNMMPKHLSLSASTLDTTSSGGNSPITNWRISSPGDDPRDVKARIKVWAQAVALASTFSHGSSS